MLKIYNTLTRKKEEFKSILSHKVSMYVCGVTIYDLCHIGHARTFIFFDLVNTYLRYLGYDLTYVRNITDIDDKIVQKSIEQNEFFSSLTSRMFFEMHRDFDSLGISRPNSEPRVTDYIREIIFFIERLIKHNHAYISSNGDVIFSIESDSDYGILSKQNLSKLQSVRKNVNTYIKKNPLDFVLWKKSKSFGPQWHSPWGMGRPGWHIECSAIHKVKFGSRFDIHGGGIDLLFPHHENEMAQSRCAYSSSQINYWIHVGLVVLNEEKMSKSLKNFFTIREVLSRHNCETIRYFLLSKHYRAQLSYSEEYLKQSYFSLERLYISLLGTEYIKKVKHIDKDEFITPFLNALNDDFNTPEAYSVLFGLAKEINRFKEKNINITNELANQLRKLGNMLGLLKQDCKKFFQSKQKFLDTRQILKIEKLIELRKYARENNLWNKADSIRDELFKMNVILEDTSDRTVWRFKRY